jgi:hypothetical protein
MIHPIFPSRKPRTDALFFALGALALVMCFLLRDYWQFKPLMSGLDDRLQQVRDSILAKSDIARDSVEMSSEASVDGDLLDSIKAHYGASTRLFLDTADVQQILYRMRIRKKEKGGLRLTEQGFTCFQQADIKFYRVQFDQKLEYTNQLVIWLDRYIDCPFYITNKEIFVFNEKMAIQLVLFSGNVAHFTSIKAKNAESA